jgi:hypothetical protein
MATVLEEYATEERRSVVGFSVGKGLNAKDIYKETYPVYGAKCFWLKAFHYWVKKFSQGRSKVADDSLRDAGVTEARVKTLLWVSTRW